MKVLIISTLLFSLSLPLQAQEASAPSEEKPKIVGAEVIFPTKEELEAKPLYWMCKVSSMVRTLKVEMKGGSCKTTYTKDGVDKDSGQSREIAHCYAVFKNIKKNLEDNMWTCKDISNVPVVVNE